MFEFVIDKKGSDSTEAVLDDDENSPDDVRELIPLDDLTDDLEPKPDRKKDCTIDMFLCDNAYLVTNYTKEGPRKDGKSYVDKLLEKSSVQPGQEKLIAVPVKKSRRTLLKERKKARDQTKGKEWYNLPATEVTEEIKNDLDILKMRSALDSKHFYKKNDIKAIPKYFQIGKVVEGAADFYNGRIPKSQRKKTLVDELLADSSFRAYQKRKYKEIVDVSRRKKKKPNLESKKKLKRNLKDDWLKWD